MGSLKRIIKIAKSDYDTLVSRGSIIKNSTTYAYDPDNVLYVVDNGLTDDYVQLGGGSGKLLSYFATSEGLSNLTNSLNQEIANRKAADPLYVNMIGMFTVGNSVDSTVHSNIQLALMTQRPLIGYVKGSSMFTSYFYINPCTGFTTGAQIGEYITLSFIYTIYNGSALSAQLSNYYYVVYSTSTLKITAVKTSKMNDSSSLTSTGYNFIDASCAWRGMYAPKIGINNTYVSIDSSVSTAVTLAYGSYHRYIIFNNASSTIKPPTKIYVLPTSPTDGDTYEFIKMSNYVYLEFYSSDKWICTNYSYIYHAVRINSLIAGRFTLIYSNTLGKWVMTQEIFNSDKFPSLVAYGKSNNGNTLTTSIILSKVYDTPTSLYLVKTANGWYDLLTPQFSSYSGYYIMMLTGLGSGTPFNGSVECNKPCLEKIDTSVYSGYTMQRFTISMSDDSTSNNGGFMFMLYVTNQAYNGSYIKTSDTSIF